MKKFLFLVVTAVSIYGLLLAGCHTMAGIGQDIQSGGHAIAKAASKDDNNASKTSNTAAKSNDNTSKADKK